MAFIIIVIIILVFVGAIILNTKLGNLKYRAKQHVLKNTGLSSSDIGAGIKGALGKKHLERFLEENPNYTEESIKDLLRQYSDKIINKNQISQFSQSVCDKMQKDAKLDKMKDMQFRRAIINYYGSSKLGAVVSYTDNRDEYNIYLTCTVSNQNIEIDKYQITKGSVVGF